MLQSNYCSYISEALRQMGAAYCDTGLLKSMCNFSVTIVIIPHLLPRSHGGTQHLLHHQHLLHLLSGGDCGSSSKRLPMVPAVCVSGPEAVRADCAPCRVPRLQGPGPHRRCPLHRKAPQRHPQPVQAAATPQGQELRRSVPGNVFRTHRQTGSSVMRNNKDETKHRQVRSNK